MPGKYLQPSLFDFNSNLKDVAPFPRVLNLAKGLSLMSRGNPVILKPQSLSLEIITQVI